MSLEIAAEPVPLQADPDGVVVVGGTRVTLDTVVAAFKDGATAEEIVIEYPSLRLPDVYSVIGYYLRRKDAVEDYLQGRQQIAEEVKKQNEGRFDPEGIRDRLMSRRTSRNA
jgi:uncharacterized protein (DUF433 family)